MRLHTRAEFIESNIKGTRVTVAEFEIVYDIVECTCGEQCPGWKSELKQESKPDYLKESNNWYLPEEAKKDLTYHEVPTIPPVSGKAWTCIDCNAVFWTTVERRKHRGHKVGFVWIEAETLKLLRGEPSKIKVITGTIE